MVETFTGLWKTVEASRVVGTVWSNDPDGQALSNKQVGLAPGFEKAGFKVVDIGMFTPLSSDFTAQITKLKAEKCEIVTGVFFAAGLGHLLGPMRSAGLQTQGRNDCQGAAVPIVGRGLGRPWRPRRRAEKARSP